MTLDRPVAVRLPRGWQIARTFDALDRLYDEAFAASPLVECRFVDRAGQGAVRQGTSWQGGAGEDAGPGAESPGLSIAP